MAQAQGLSGAVPGNCKDERRTLFDHGGDLPYDFFGDSIAEQFASQVFFNIINLT
jgi:hypothetical protein